MPSLEFSRTLKGTIDWDPTVVRQESNIHLIKIRKEIGLPPPPPDVVGHVHLPPVDLFAEVAAQAAVSPVFEVHARRTFTPTAGQDLSVDVLLEITVRRDLPEQPIDDSSIREIVRAMDDAVDAVQRNPRLQAELRREHPELKGGWVKEPPFGQISLPLTLDHETIAFPVPADIERAASARPRWLEDRVLDQLLSEPAWPHDAVSDEEFAVRPTIDAAGRLMLSGPGAAGVAARLLRADRRRIRLVRPVDQWTRPVRPIASLGVLVMLAITVAFAAVRLTWVGLVIYAVAMAAVEGTTLVIASRSGRSLVRCLLLFAAPTIVIVYGIAYGFMMLGPGATVHVANVNRAHVSDPLMLSFGIATTGGFLDYSLTGAWPRGVALAEMLLLVSLAGGTAAALATTALRLLRARPEVEEG